MDYENHIRRLMYADEEVGELIHSHDLLIECEESEEIINPEFVSDLVN